MTSPRFSIVVPTREGGSTLPHTLRTCLEQDFEDYEVVVCDNFSSPAVKQVVDGFASPKIRYLRAPQPLAMSSNWELAVSHAAGEFITVLGDDDGLLPHALRVLDHLLGQQRTAVIRWGAAFYLWPNIALPGEANYLRIPLTREVRTLDGRQAIASVIAFRECYTSLPMLYNSVVHRDVLASLRDRVGRIFRTRYPDVCSGFLVAYAAGTYTSVALPMTVAGLSGKSVGIGHHFLPQRSDVGAEFVRLNAAEGIRSHRAVPDLHVFPVVPVADCFQAAKEALFPADGTLALDRKTVVSHCVWCLRADNLDHWNECLAIIRGTLADDPALLAWFDEKLAGFPPQTSGPLRLRSPVLGFDGEQLHLDAGAFGIADVHGAALLCEKILCCRHADLSRFCGQGAVPSVSSLLAEQLREKEAAIQELSVAADARLRLVEELSAAAGHWRARAEGLEALAEESRQRLEELERELQRYRRLTAVPRKVYQTLRDAACRLSGRKNPV